MNKKSKVTIKGDHTMEWEEADLNDLCEMLGCFVIMLGNECLEGGNSIGVTLQNIEHAVDCGVATIRKIYDDRMKMN